MRWAPDLEKSAAIQHFNVYFTHHLIPMDLKPSPTNTTGVTINILTSIMSSSQDGQIDGQKACVCVCTSVCVTAVMAAAMRNRRVIEFLWCHQFGEVSRWAGPGTEPGINKRIEIITSSSTNINSLIMLFLHRTAAHTLTNIRFTNYNEMHRHPSINTFSLHLTDCSTH